MTDVPRPSVPRPGPPAPLPSPPAATPAPRATPSVPDDGSTPQTGDLVVDAALRDLAAVDPTDLDAVVAAGESVHATLTSRLSDLGS